MVHANASRDACPTSDGSTTVTSATNGASNNENNNASRNKEIKKNSQQDYLDLLQHEIDMSNDDCLVDDDLENNDFSEKRPSPQSNENKLLQEDPQEYNVPNSDPEFEASSQDCVPTSYVPITNNSMSDENRQIVEENESQHDDADNKSCLHLVLHCFNCLLSKVYPLVLLLTISILWPCGAISLKQLTLNIDSTLRHGIPGSPSALAEDAFAAKYKEENESSSHPAILVVLSLTNTTANNNTSPPSSLVHNAYAKNTSLALQPYLEGLLHNVQSTHGDNEDYHNSRNRSKNNQTTEASVEISSYYSYCHQNLSLLARPFMAPDHQMTVLQLLYQTQDRRTVLPIIMNGLDDFYKDASPSVDVGFTGLDYFSSDLRASTQRDLKRMDVFVLPIALVFVGWTLCPRKAWMLWIFPLAAMISTVSVWSWVTNYILIESCNIQITQFTPSIMMSLTLGMGMDYSLFLLARYYEAVKKQQTTFDKSRAIHEMLQHAGNVVMVSGLTLMCTFLGLVALPLSMLQSVGMGAAVAIASAIVCNLVLCPTLLYTPLGDWILVPLPDTHHVSTDSRDNANDDESVVVRDTSNDDNYEHFCELRQPLLTEESGDAVVESTPRTTTDSSHNNVIVLPSKPSSIWMTLSRHLLHPYKSIIIMLLLWQMLLWPLGKNALRLKSSSIAFESLLPSRSQSMLTYRRLLAGLGGGPGKMAPYRILLDGTSKNVSIDSPTAFEAMHNLVQELRRPNTAVRSSSLSRFAELQNETLALPSLDSTDVVQSSMFGSSPSTYGRSSLQMTLSATFTGVSVLDNIQIPYAVYVASRICGATNSCPVDAMRALNVLDSRVTSEDRMATYLNVELSVSPFSDEGVQWLEETRRRIGDLDIGMDVFVDGSAAIAHDTVEAVYQAFPWVVIISLGVVFCLLGVYFGSVVPPIRSVVSICCTLAVSFGAAVLVYQDGILGNVAATHFRSLLAMEPELCWLVPIMSFSIMVGLALDYDVFLVSRIYEIRSMDKYQHQSSIVAGLDATGGIITAAGVIMAISFGSLLWSASPALDQWSFLVTTAVLLDTFVIRTVVVPILIGWTGIYSWYPTHFEIGTTRIEDFDDS